MLRKRKFTTEFKIKAVELAKKSDKPIARTAKYLGVGSSVLGQWIKKYAELKEAALRKPSEVVTPHPQKDQ
ncbi:MAG: transposase [Wolbachia sp.]